MRKLMLGAAMAALLLTAGCTTAQINTAITDEQTAIQDVQNTIAAACGYVPTVESITADVGTLFGTSGVATALAVNGGIALLQSDLCSAVATTSSARLRAKLRGSSPVAPVAIGTTKSGVQVQGYR